MLAELGYPIMVMPFSQFVGSQAVMNVATGKRYKNVPDQVIKYALGEFGQPPGEMDEGPRAAAPGSLSRATTGRRGRRA